LPKFSGFTKDDAKQFLDWLEGGTLLGRPLRELAGTPYWLLRLLSFYHRRTRSSAPLGYRHLLISSLAAALESLQYRKRLQARVVRELRLRLCNLAFHMTDGGLLRAEGDDAKKALHWIAHHDPIEWFEIAVNPPPDLRGQELDDARRTLALGRDAGVLLPGDAIEFEHQLTQECFCFLYCKEHGVDEILLKHASQPQFFEMWRLWAQQQPDIVSEIALFLYPAYGRYVISGAASVLGMIGDARTAGDLLPLLKHNDFVVLVSAPRSPSPTR
jgi:hypothetical protein